MPTTCEVSARVNIHQVFSNTSVNATSRAKYVFPVPARAAVCAFEMHLSDGRLLVGVAKEKERASAEHEQAAREGKVTTLLEWATDDGNRLASSPSVITYIFSLCHISRIHSWRRERHCSTDSMQIRNYLSVTL